MTIGYANRRLHPTKTIDAQISELIPVLSDRRYQCKMPDHQRQRLFGSGKVVAVDSPLLTMLVNAKLSSNDLVSIYLAGGTVTLCRCSDVVEIYTKLHQYLSLWVERSNALPNEPMPPIEDFVNIDDYLSSIHLEYILQSTITKEPVKAPVSQFRARRFSEGLPTTTPESPLAKPKRYVSLIDQFHKAVWSRDD